MKTLHPGVLHPERDWIENNLRDACLVDRGSSSTEEGSVTLASLAALLEGQAAEIVSLKEHKAKSDATFSSFRQRNTLTELRLRQDGLSDREKEKSHRMMAYSNIMLKSHASNLFDIEASLSDVLGSAGSAVPEIAARLRHAAATGSEHMDEGLPQGFVSVAELIPLFESLGRLHSEVDGMVHNLESCATSKVGYKGMRDSINREIDGDNSFSGTRSDRDYHSALQTHREKNFLANAAHAKALRSSASGHHSAGSSQIGAQGGSGARTPAQLLKKKLRNSKNRKQATARKRAAKAEEAKKKGGADKGAPANP